MNLSNLSLFELTKLQNQITMEVVRRYSVVVVILVIIVVITFFYWLINRK